MNAASTQPQQPMQPLPEPNVAHFGRRATQAGLSPAPERIPPAAPRHRQTTSLAHTHAHAKLSILSPVYPGLAKVIDSPTSSGDALVRRKQPSMDRQPSGIDSPTVRPEKLQTRAFLPVYEQNPPTMRRASGGALET